MNILDSGERNEAFFFKNAQIIIFSQRDCFFYSEQERTTVFSQQSVCQFTLDGNFYATF